MKKITLLLFAVLFTLIGCASTGITPEDKQILDEVSKANTPPIEPFRITVESIPAGASVHVLEDDGQAGPYLGKTPLELKFVPNKIQRSTNRTLTIETKDAKTAFGQGKAKAYFKCLVVKDGYHPEIIYEEGSRMAFEESGRDLAIKALSGKHITFSVILREAADRGDRPTN